MELPLIKFGYDGEWVIRAREAHADRSRHSADEYAGTPFENKFVPSPIDCKPWVDAQVAGWDLFFSQDVSFMLLDPALGIFQVPEPMSGRIGSFGPFHLGVYCGVHIKTSPGWVTLIDHVADPKARDSLPFTTEAAILETDWYAWFKNFVVIRPHLRGREPMDVFNIERGTPLCRVRVLPRAELVACEEFTAEDYAEYEKAAAEYKQAELDLFEQHRFRPVADGRAFYPLYKHRALEHRMKR